MHHLKARRCGVLLSHYSLPYRGRQTGRVRLGQMVTRSRFELLSSIMQAYSLTTTLTCLPVFLERFRMRNHWKKFVRLGAFLLKFQESWRVMPWRVAITDVSKSPRSFETSVPMYQLIRRNFPQNLNFQNRRCENLKSNTSYYEVILCKPSFEILIAAR